MNCNSVTLAGKPSTCSYEKFKYSYSLDSISSWLGPSQEEPLTKTNPNMSHCKFDAEKFNQRRDLTSIQLHWVFQITYKMAVAMNKASILLLYLRIMPQRLYRIAIFTLLTVVALFAVATTIAGVFQCIPVDKAWNKKKPGHCYNLVEAWYTNAVFSIVTDFLILMLPMHMVYKLQRDRREKFLLYAVFGLGFL